MEPPLSLSTLTGTRGEPGSAKTATDGGASARLGVALHARAAIVIGAPPPRAQSRARSPLRNALGTSAVRAAAPTAGRGRPRRHPGMHPYARPTPTALHWCYRSCRTPCLGSWTSPGCSSVAMPDCQGRHRCLASPRRMAWMAWTRTGPTRTDQPMRRTMASPPQMTSASSSTMASSPVVVCRAGGRASMKRRCEATMERLLLRPTIIVCGVPPLRPVLLSHSLPLGRVALRATIVCTCKPRWAYGRRKGTSAERGV